MQNIIRGRGIVRAGLALGLVMTIGLGLALAQVDGEPGRRGRPDFRNMSEEQRTQMRERMMQRMQERREQQAQRLKEELSLSDEEFSAIRPLIDKIRELTMERGRLIRPMGEPGFGRGGFMPEPQRSMSVEAEKLQQANAALEEALNDRSTSSEQIQTRLAELRSARAGIDVAIANIREDLRTVLVARQEAVLVMHGILE